MKVRIKQFPLIAEDEPFVQSTANAHSRSTFELGFTHLGINRLSRIKGRTESQYFHQAGLNIDSHLHPLNTVIVAHRQFLTLTGFSVLLARMSPESRLAKDLSAFLQAERHLQCPSCFLGGR